MSSTVKYKHYRISQDPINGECYVSNWADMKFIEKYDDLAKAVVAIDGYATPDVVDATLPYLITSKLSFDVTYAHNPNYPQHTLCKCGHTYDRHFDSYEHMEAVGCKYCECWEFVAGDTPL